MFANSLNFVYLSKSSVFLFAAQMMPSQKRFFKNMVDDLIFDVQTILPVQYFG